MAATAPCLLLLAFLPPVVTEAVPDDLPDATIDGTGPGWRALGEADFADVNGEPNTWTWKGDVLKCTGTPVGVLRSREAVKNFELVVRWRHLKAAGNSGVFAWVPDAALADIKPGQLPRGGIEVQMLDHGYTEQYESRTGKPGDWFSTNGDVFPVGTSTMTPFEPLSPNGQRSFPSEDRSRGAGSWNHYYVRCINGEVRLWVNGKEVSGGTDCEPAEGYFCLEAEGSPIEFRDMRLRVLP